MLEVRHIARICLALVLLAGCSPSPDAEIPQGSSPSATADDPDSLDAERPGWADAFAAHGGQGTFVLLHTSSGRTERLDPARAARRTLPASTFKVYNALAALDAGVVRDPDSLFVWDGVERQIPAWNRDHSLRTGMEASTVWLFQRVAEDIGRERYAASFAREPYGDGRIGDDVALFWLDGTLRISADEQVGFLERLRTGETAFSVEDEATVRDLLPILVDEPGARMRAKTGWGFEERTPGVETPVGWLVGYVERTAEAGGDVVFALAVEPAPNAPDFDMATARLAIARDLLAGEGILSAPSR